MAIKPAITELVIASHNQGKIVEIEDLLSPLCIRIIAASSLGLPEPEETGDTFEANALLKANAAVDGAQKPALADDSGLVIPALGGAPGIYSARWAGPDKDFMLAMKRIESLLCDKGATLTDIDAYFVCVLALALPDGTAECLRGEIHGKLTFPPRGERGFGYDPLFCPIINGAVSELTFAEIPLAIKQTISHRAVAFELLFNYLRVSTKSGLDS